jgi:hypothetical protein
MAETQYSSESPNQNYYEDWDPKLDKEVLDSGSVNKSLNESSLVLDNGTLYGSSKNLGKRRLISSLEDSENIIKEDNREVITHVNEMLKRNGFAVIKSSSHSSFLRLIEQLLRVIEEMTYGINFASLDDIFKRTFGRGIDKNSKVDSIIANLISVYEVQKRAYEQDIERLAKELNNKRRTIAQVEENMRQNYHKALSDMQEKLLVLENRCSEVKIDKKNTFEADHSGIIEEVCKVLNIKQSSQIVPAVVKLEKVLRAVPSLEKFIKDVFFIVSSNDSSEEKLTMENLIPSLKRSFKELHELKMKRPGKIPSKFEYYQEVIEHFKHLFEIDKDEDLIETMDQVFLFVHELRSFLKSIRLTLSLDEAVTVNGILVRIKNIIERQ